MKHASSFALLVALVTLATAPLKAAGWDPPQLMTRYDPIFPAELRRAGMGGWARITFVVETDGRVSDVGVLAASHPLFGEAAARAAWGWQYLPATNDGRLARARLTQVVVFNIGNRKIVPTRMVVRAPVAVTPGEIPPELLEKPGPIHALALEQRNGGWSATVEFWVLPDGSVQDVKVIKATKKSLRQLVLEFVPNWRFAPPLHGGTPTRMRLRVVIDFEPDDFPTTNVEPAIER